MQFRRKTYRNATTQKWRSVQQSIYVATDGNVPRRSIHVMRSRYGEGTYGPVQYVVRVKLGRLSVEGAWR